MKTHRYIVSLLCCAALLTGTGFGADADVPLPEGVKAVWDLDKAVHEKTDTRERICLNGLWRWQPAAGKSEAGVPASTWGYFKVPGCWPGISDYMQKDSQTVFAHPAWKNEKLSGIHAAWYQREIAIPKDWDGRRIVLSADVLNSFATVYVDGKSAGEMHFPGGELDLTAFCKAGSQYLLSLRVAALPLKGVLLSYVDSAAGKEVSGAVERRGLCGDVWLVATPAGPRITDIKIDPSVNKKTLSLDVAVEGLEPGARYKFTGVVSTKGAVETKFSTPEFTAAELKDGRIIFTQNFMPAKLWDVHTPKNQSEVQLTLMRDVQNVDAALPVRFGFREFRIEGRDFYLNGTRIFLSVVPFDNPAISAAAATYEAVKESFLRLKGIGVNCVYTHNYGCEPGSHLSFGEMLRAADDVGMLVSLSQPHFSHYDWKAADADAKNGYARHAEYYVRTAQNHPSVVFYSMSHNATGYNEDMNPNLIDGLTDPRTDGWSKNNAKLALRAEAIVRRLDPSRIVYHHASGDLGALWNSNFYPNMVPIQELDDWFEHWAAKGIKPAITCEYGAPFTWDWSNYRGWFKGQRTFGSADVQWEFCFAEWNSQFLGDRAFEIGEAEKANLRYEDKQFKAGKTWHRWDYPYEIGSRVFDDRETVMGKYISDNWRAFRTWGLSGNSPWEYGHFWKLRPGADRSRKQLKVDWEHLQGPGYSPDFIADAFDNMSVSYARTDWIPTAAGAALLRNNQALLGYIAGKESAVTSKDHNYLAGETVEKQLVVINNSREAVTCTLGWAISLGGVGKTNAIPIAAGEQKRVPLKLLLTSVTPEIQGDERKITASFKFSTGETQEDVFAIHVLPLQPAVKINTKIALFDPSGETKKLLDSIGVQYASIDATAKLDSYEILVIGKAALKSGGSAPDFRRVRDGLRVIVFEQSSEVLEQRFGFRVEEYGLRQVFARVPGHPLLAGLTGENLRDWRGEATLLPPQLKYELNPKFNGAPTVKWCGIDVPRLWRCGCRGSVASVLIEKPARGDFLPILDGGFSLQYSPLMEYREGLGMILFCQMDVTGRTESDPAAERLARNIFTHVSGWIPIARRNVLYAGEAAGKNYLEKLGIALRAYDGGKLATDDLLVVGPGGAVALVESRVQIGEWLNHGGHLLAIGLDGTETGTFLPFPVTMKKEEHIAAFFAPPAMNSAFAGIGPADVHSREPRIIPLITAGGAIVGDGVLAKADQGNVYFCQLVPWSFDYAKQYNLKRSYRRSSFLLNRLLSNLGATASTPLLSRCDSPVDPAKPEKRWLDGLYLDIPEELDDPYRFFRW